MDAPNPPRKTVATGPFRVVPYDRDARPLGAELTVGTDGEGARALADTARVVLPPKTRAYAVYDGRGGLSGIALVPPEPLTDDPDTTACAMDAAATRVATGSNTGDLRLWDLATGDPVWTRAPADEPIAGVAFVDKGPWVLAWSDDGPLLLVERESGELAMRVEDPQVGSFDVAVAPEGDEVALTGARVVRIALPGGELRPPLDAGVADAAGDDDEGVEWLAYLRDGRTIAGVRASASRDELVFWDRVTGERVAAMPLEHGVAAADLAPDGALIAVGVAAEPAAVLLVDVATRAVVRTVATEATALHDVRFAPDGGTLLVHTAGAGVLAIDPATGAVRARVREDATAELALPVEGDVVPDDAEEPGILVTRSRAGVVELTALAERPHIAPVGRACSGDGSRYAVVPLDTDNNFVAVVDVARGAGLATLAHRANVQQIWMSADGSRVAVRAAGHVTVWKLPDAPAVLSAR